MRIDAVIVSCEHGGKRVPAGYAALFRGAARELASHRGWDPGALGLARRIARRLHAPLHAATVTRLLVELNRSEGHPRLFSRRSRVLPAAERERLLAGHYRPYRQAVERDALRTLRRGGRVLHLSVHTFTPVLDGVRRDVDVGLLHDPARPAERSFCDRWARVLRAASPRLRVRKNRPYRGTSDGLTTTLRERLGARYLGIELEVSQRFFTAGGAARSPVPGTVERSVEALLQRYR